MKAKVIIENSQTTILLIPENDFDTDIVTKIHENKRDFDLHIETVDTKGVYDFHPDPIIKVNLIKNEKIE